MNGADLAACADILDEVTFARTLDPERQDEPFLTEFEDRVRLYMEQLRKRSTPRTET